MDADQPLLEIRDLRTHFHIRQGTVRAVDGVSLSVFPGQTLAIVGESGCGKSITAQSILRILPRAGRIEHGRIHLQLSAGGPGRGEIVDLVGLNPKGSAMREIRGGEIGMIFQEPMSTFSPVYTIGHQIAEAARLHRTADYIEPRELVLDMLAHVGFAHPDRTWNQYPHELSGGMRQRAMIAMALIGRPRILIADEPTTALDVTTEAQILRLMKRLQAEFGMAIIFITHDLGVVARMADQVAVMYLGNIVEQGDVDTVFHAPRHPYLKALLRSVPRLDPAENIGLEPISGMVPDPFSRPAGCPFHPRCPEFMPGTCDTSVPQLLPAVAEPGRTRAACHLYT